MNMEILAIIQPQQAICRGSPRYGLFFTGPWEEYPGKPSLTPSRLSPTGSLQDHTGYNYRLADPEK